MAEPAAVQAHWTRAGVLARIDGALTELGHDPQNLNPEILATLEHLHSGGFATTRDQAKRASSRESTGCLNAADCSRRRNIQSGRAVTLFFRCHGPMTPR